MTDDLGCCGVPLVQSTNMDRLALQGTLAPYRVRSGAKGVELHDRDTERRESKNLACASGHADVWDWLKTQLRVGRPVFVQGGKAETDTRDGFCN